MKTFKSYIADTVKKTPEGYIIVDEPIHYKMKPNYKKTKDGYVIVDEPIHYKNGKSKIQESAHKDEFKAAVEHNQKHHGSDEDLSVKLHKKQGAHISGTEDEAHIHRYTDDADDGTEHTGSRRLNRSLIRGTPPHHMDREDEKTHKAIMKHAGPSGHEYHVFSGTSRNFEEIAHHEKTNKFHFPAHTSATHSEKTAKQFAIGKKEPDRETYHIMHVHVKPHNKVLHTSGLSQYPHEHETIIPAGTNMKYSHTSDHKDPTDGKHYKVHHFHIE